MYCEHFGLLTLPFSDAPDPRFHVPLRDHEDALTSLVCLTRERSGFALIVGESGLGKTHLTRMLPLRVPQGTRTALISPGPMVGLELLEEICRAFEIGEAGSLHAGLDKIGQLVTEQNARGSSAILLIDDACSIQAEALEQIRSLTMRDSGGALAVALLGRPSILELFVRPDLRRVRQSVWRAGHLHRLDARTIESYVRQRLDTAGAHGRLLLTHQAVHAVIEHGNGAPGPINRLCHAAMTIAFNHRAPEVTAAMVHEAADLLAHGINIDGIAAPRMYPVAGTGVAGTPFVAAPVESTHETQVLAPASHAASTADAVLDRLQSLESTVQRLDTQRRLNDERYDSLLRRIERIETVLDTRDGAAPRVAASAASPTLGGLPADRLRQKVLDDTAAELLKLEGKAADLRNTIADAIEDAERRLQAGQARIDASLADGTTMSESLDASLVQAGTAVQHFHEQLTELLSNAEAVRQSLNDAVPAGHTLTALQQLVLDGSTIREDLNRIRSEVASEANAATESLRAIAEELFGHATPREPQIPSGARSASDHANGHGHADSVSQTLRRSAATLLDDARETATHLIEQATLLTQRAESCSQDARRQLQILRDEIRQETSGWRDDVQRALAESRTAQDRSDDLLNRAEEIHQRTRKLLSLPQSMIDEANERATALSGMSKTLQQVIARLNQLAAQAEERAAQLTGATAVADDKLSELTSQSDRAVQLVGLIRQLSGAIDQRAEQLRQCVGIAEHVARMITTENPSLRIGEMLRIPANVPARREPATTQTTSRRASPSPVIRAEKVATAASARTGPTLAQVAQNNARLNAWLRETLASAEKKPSSPGNGARKESVQPDAGIAQ